MSKVEYDAVVSKTNLVSAEFRKAQEAYRARKIGDAEFLAARALFDAAEKAFDIVFAEIQAE